MLLALMSQPLAAQQAGAGSGEIGSVGFNPLKHLVKAPGWIWQTEKRAFRSDNLKYWGVAAGATALALLLDERIDDELKAEKPLPGLTRDFDKAGNLVNQAGWAVVYVTGLLARDQKMVRTGQAMVIAGASANIFGAALWFAIGRERPVTAPDPFTFHPFDVDNLDLAFPPFKVLPSFPSSHVAGNFAIATVITRYHGAVYGAPLYLFGGFVGFSRMAREGHYLSDVVAGMFLGTLMGFAATDILERDHRVFDRVRVSMLPAAGGGRYGLRLQAVF